MTTIVDDAFALLVTWTTYGTWLPGDARGHASNVLDEDRRYVRRDKRFATPSAPGDERTRDRARQLQNDSTVLLDAELAVVAAQAVIDACRKRGWRISRGALMANHVHVVITGCPADGSSVKRILKGVSQTRLSDYAGRGCPTTQVEIADGGPAGAATAPNMARERLGPRNSTSRISRGFSSESQTA